MTRTNGKRASVIRKARAAHKAAMREYDRASMAYYRAMERPGEAAAAARMRTMSDRLDRAARAVERAEAV